MTKKAWIWMVLGVFACSCERALIEDGATTDPVENFNYLWNEVNNHYAYFELKQINWDSVYAVYRPQIAPTTTELQLFDVCAAMLNELEDGHVNLTSPFNVSRYAFKANAPENFNFRLLEENYIGCDYYLTGPFAHQWLTSRIGYVRYASFSNRIEPEDLVFLNTYYASSEGLVLDLRSNGGGSLGNVNRLIGWLVSSKEPVIYSSVKTGPEPNDFSDAEVLHYGSGSAEVYTHPVVVLINRQSYSATSFFTTLARQLDRVTVIGDTTGGGMGIPTGGELPNGWKYRFSGSRTTDPQGNDFENGVPPDIVQYMDSQDEAAGVDSILERALDDLQ